MNLDRLRLFVEVADAGGFTAAARRLKMQRSSVSRGVAALEADLGVQLFNRSTRHVALTTAGEALYSEVKPAISSLAGALSRLPERSARASGQLRVTAPNDFAIVALPRALAGFSRRYPDVRVDVHVTNRLVDLVAEGYDAALRPGRMLPDSSLVARRICGVSLGIYAAPDYLARAGTPRTLAEAGERDWVVGPGGLHPGVAVTAEPTITGDDVLFARACARAGLGLAGLPAFVAREDVLAGTLVRVLASQARRPFSLYLLHPPLAHYPLKLAVFRDYLVEYFRNHPLDP